MELILIDQDQLLPVRMRADDHFIRVKVHLLRCTLTRSHPLSSSDE